MEVDISHIIRHDFRNLKDHAASLKYAKDTIGMFYRIHAYIIKVSTCAIAKKV